MTSRPVIAIDGPVASGKTTVGQKLATRLGLRFLDTGSMYRGVTWLAATKGISVADQGALGDLANSADMAPVADGRGLMVGGRLLVQELRSPEVEGLVSRVAEILEVRKAMVRRQRELAREGAIVVVGRDIGTDVAPEADLKVFLNASPGERARRRHSELQAEGAAPDYDQVLKELEQRDEVDSSRANSPLRKPPDAHLIDTEGVPVDQIVEQIILLVSNSR